VQVTLRLVAVPEATSTALAVYPSLRAAGDAVAQVVAAGMLPVAMEIMDALAMEAAEASVKPGYPAGAALLIVELEGEREEVDVDAAACASCSRPRAPPRSPSRRTPRSARSCGRAARAPSPRWAGSRRTTSSRTGSCRARGLGEALERIGEMSEEAGIRVANVFHAGDGNLHPLILFDGRDEGAMEAAEELAGRILALCVELGGSITGEHGVGVEKLKYLPLMFAEDDVALMHRLRDAVDPARLANRGKMLLTASAPPQPAIP
jgi:glycolate oxidase